MWFLILEINYFQGDLPVVSAITKTLQSCNADGNNKMIGTEEIRRASDTTFFFFFLADARDRPSASFLADFAAIPDNFSRITEIIGSSNLQSKVGSVR